MVEVLRQVARALSAGMGVNVAPLNAMLTTQEAADFLGISRPALVRIVERQEIPMERPGRHRYVRLSDLLDYQESSAETHALRPAGLASPVGRVALRLRGAPQDRYGHVAVSRLTQTAGRRGEVTRTAMCS